jgi:hypothetical protein
VPTAVIPTIASSAEEELRLLDIRRNGQWREPIDWHRTRLAGDTDKANQHRADIDRRSHDCFSLIVPLRAVDNPETFCLFPLSIREQRLTAAITSRHARMWPCSHKRSHQCALGIAASIL